MGENIYLEKFRLRVSDYDYKDQILLSAILDLCQDVAGKHAIELGVGYDDMIVQDKIWMVIRTKVEVIKNPPFSCNVLVETWPIEPNRVDMDREYLIMSEDGKEEYIKVTSKWVVCSATSRKLLRAKEASFNIDEYHNERLFDEPFNKLEFDTGLEFKTNFIKTNYLDLDHNGHINNIKYGNFMLLAIPELQGKLIKKCQIDYIHELQKDEDVQIDYCIDDKTFYVKGICSNQDAFVAKIEIE